MTRHIAVTNSGKRVTDADAQTMCAALAQELGAFALAWNMGVPEIAYYADPSAVPAGAEIVDLADQPPLGEDGVLGEHFELDARPRGVAYAGFALDHGGSPLSSPPSDTGTTVASVLSHEVFEQLVNPDINRWVDGPITITGVDADGNKTTETFQSMAYETGDPGEPSDPEDYIVVMVGDVEVWLANYVWPEYFDPEATQGTQVDELQRLPGPFTCGPGGYVNVRNEPGSETQRFGEKMPPETRALKKAIWARRHAMAARAAKQSVPEHGGVPVLQPGDKVDGDPPPPKKG